MRSVNQYIFHKMIDRSPDWCPLFFKKRRWKKEDPYMWAANKPNHTMAHVNNTKTAQKHIWLGGARTLRSSSGARVYIRRLRAAGGSYSFLSRTAQEASTESSPNPSKSP